MSRSRSITAAAGAAGSPEALIRLDTSVLEGRLSAIGEQWQADLKGVRAQVTACSTNVQSMAADVDAIQRFLLSYHNREMRSALSGGRGEAHGEADSLAAGPVGRLVDAGTGGSDTESLLGMVAVARRLLAENEALRGSLDSATAAVSTHSSGNTGLQHEVEQLRQQTAQQSALLRSITAWLGMPDATLATGAVSTAPAASVGPSAAAVHVPMGLSMDGQSTEAVVARSPLLLSFRQILLRDLTERVSAVVEQQSKDFHDAVAHLEDRLQSGGSAAAMLTGASSGISTIELQEAVEALRKRLKEFDDRVVKRDEFTSLMRTKADSLMLPAKADNAALTELEERLIARCTELEERCAYAEAERAEFRALLRSLMAAQSRPSISGAATTAQRGDSAQSAQSARRAQSTAVMSGTLLGDVLPGAMSSFNSTVPLPAPLKHESPQSMSSTALRSSAAALPPQQLYRVVGGAANGGLYGVSGTGVGPKEPARGHGAVAAAPRLDTPLVSAPPAGSADGGVVAIGMTPPQAPYAAFVSQQLTRRQVASLPALPYERVPSR